MNLIEARKLGHEGWVRSPRASGGQWVRLKKDMWWGKVEKFGKLSVFDIEVDDWEPKPREVFEAEVWICDLIPSLLYKVKPFPDELDAKHWRKIRVREVVE